MLSSGMITFPLSYFSWKLHSLLHDGKPSLRDALALSYIAHHKESEYLSLAARLKGQGNVVLLSEDEDERLLRENLMISAKETGR
jgi:hypothetical protein